jgi:hypothetical protein
MTLFIKELSFRHAANNEVMIPSANNGGDGMSLVRVWHFSISLDDITAGRMTAVHP